MNADQLIDAIGAVRDAAVLDAKSLRHEDSPAAAGRRLRKITVGAAAVLAVLLGMAAAAFAVDQDFRAAVLSFFQISAEDHVERVPAEDQPLAAGDGDAAESGVTVTRVRVPNNGHAVNGLFAICSDEIEYKQGSHYELYRLEGGDLARLPLQSVRRDFSYNGVSYRVELEWAQDGARCALGYAALPDGLTGECRALQFVPGGEGELLALLDGKYPVIIDLYGGGVQEIIPASVMDALPFLRMAHMTQDGRYLLLSAGKYYCAEIGTGVLTCLDGLCGAELAWCSYIGDGAFSCHALSGGAVDEAALAAYARGELPDAPVDFGTVTTWYVDAAGQTAGIIDSGTAATVFTNPDALWHGTERSERLTPGLVYIPRDEGAYMLEVDEDRRLYTIDLRSGDRNRITGVLWPDVDWPHAEPVGSPEGDKLALTERDPADGSLRRISVIDFEETRIFSIRRDTEEVGNEHYADWFDNDTIMVDNDVTDEEGYTTGDSWYYLYRLC